MQLNEAVEQAARTRIEFGGDVLVFSFRSVSGQEWEGCLEEWVGNGNFPRTMDQVLRFADREYIAVGAPGGGADLILVRDDAVVCYLNDFDQQISEVAASVRDFVALLHAPKV